MKNQDKELNRILSIIRLIFLYTLKENYISLNTCYIPSNLGESQRSNISPQRPLSFSISIWVCFQDNYFILWFMSSASRRLSPDSKEYFKSSYDRVYKICNRYKKYQKTLNRFGLIIDQEKRQLPLVWSHDRMSITTPNEQIQVEANKTYSQDWEAYNQAQTQEKLLFFELLSELTDIVPKQKYKGNGRPPSDFGEMIFSICLKTYLDFSSRRVESDIKIAQQLGYIIHVPHFNTILKYLNNPKLREVLHHLITLSSLPLKQVEENFTVDSSGFSTSMFGRWVNARTGVSEKRLFKKAHLFSGVKTNIITSVEVTDGFTHDSNVFLFLLMDTNLHFDMKEVSADAGYSSRYNMTLVSKCGAVPFIAFRKNTVGNSKGSYIWSKMYKYFSENKEEFLQHYHRRSNAETVFSMIKRKQGSSLRTKNDIAQVNEIMCKCLVHNICVLIQEMFELGIKIDFEEVKPFDFMCRINL